MATGRMRRPLTTRLLALVFLAGGLCGAAAALAASAGGEAALEVAKARFRRPAAIPFPADNPYSDQKRTLGDALFHDTRLSIDNSLSCASCHDRDKGFADGKAQGRGVSGQALKRHTPGLWNLAWGAQSFWDGRARSLEEQATGPITNPDEMAQPLDALVSRLSGDAELERKFAAAFPREPQVTVLNIARALATYERTLVSPETRFDRWIGGDAKALTEQEIAGFRLFAGKAGCSNCHSGFALTDNAFHDIGLPGDDRGRGVVLRLPAADHAFKTPGLREIGRSAPYMHDGSFATLDDVLRHYESGVIDRPTLSRDLPRRLQLADPERAVLLAFLRTLTTETEPRPPDRIVVAAPVKRAPAARVTTVSQSDKAFSPTHIALRRGERLWIVNNDTRTHNVRVFDQVLDFDSGAQEPGETVEIPFPKAGSFLLFCGIHPNMELRVEVGQ